MTKRSTFARVSTQKILESLFVALIGSACIGGGCCGDEEDYVRIIPRMPPGNPGGMATPPFDPKTITDAECAILCDGGYDKCEADVFEGNIPVVLCTEYPTCDAGRRPAGLDEPRMTSHARTSLTTVAGAWLARAAHLEAASVFAFETLAQELETLGAPADLVARARTAANDETRHARVVGALARRRGVRVPRVRIAPPPPRTAVAIALENAVEGCVQETFAALVAHHQAERAGARDVRRAMATIAKEETSHAALAWDVHTWLMCVLSPAERRRVERARRDAARRLAVTWASHPGTRTELGLPASDHGRGLADALARDLDAIWPKARRRSPARDDRPGRPSAPARGTPRAPRRTGETRAARAPS